MWFICYESIVRELFGSIRCKHVVEGIMKALSHGGNYALVNVGCVIF